MNNNLTSNDDNIGIRYNLKGAGYEKSEIRTNNNSSNSPNKPYNKRETLRFNSLINERKSLYVTESNGTNIRESIELKGKKLSQISWDALNKIFSKKNQGFYCPHCSHCNNIKDEALDSYMAMKEAKSIINKGFDYICKNYDTDQSYLDILLNDNNKKEENDLNNNIVFNNKNKSNNNNNYKSKSKIISSNSIHYPMSICNLNNNMNQVNGEIENKRDNKKKDIFDIESLISSYPKNLNDRNVLQLVTHFLDALISDKICINTIVTPNIYEKLKESLLSQGIAFKENDSEIEFDKEIDMLFDKNTKEKIRNLFAGELIKLISFN